MTTDSHADEQPWLSISEAARRLGVSRQAIAHRIKRGTLRTKPSNRGLLVQLPADATVAATVPATVDTDLAQPLPQALQERIAGLEARLADRDAEIQRLHAELTRQADAHRSERAELLANAQAERERLLNLLERATVRPGLLERLFSLLRPGRSPGSSNDPT